MGLLRPLFVACCLLAAAQAFSAERSFTILHTNDWQSRLLGFGPNNEYSPATTGDDDTVGGVARLATLLEQRRAAAGEQPDPGAGVLGRPQGDAELAVAATVEPADGSCVPAAIHALELADHGGGALGRRAAHRGCGVQRRGEGENGGAVGEAAGDVRREMLHVG